MAAQTEDNEKSVVITHILYLEEQLESCKLTLKELEKQNKDLVRRYRALEKEKREKTEKLKELVSAEEKKVEDLTKQLKEQKQKAKQDKEFLQQQHLPRKQKLLELIDEYQQKNIKQAEVLEEKKKQVIAQRQQESELEAMEKQLVHLTEDQEAEIDSLKINLEEEIKTFDESLQKQNERLLPCEVSLVLVKERATNRKRMRRISFLLKKNSTLSEQLEALTTRLKDLISSKQDLTKESDALNQQNTTFEKEVDELWHIFRQLYVEKAEYVSNHSDAQNETETLRSFLTKTSEQHRQKAAMLGRLEAELQKETTRRRQLEDVKQKAAIILKHILTNNDKPSEVLWKTERLVEILKNSAVPRTRSTSNRSSQQSRQGQKPHVE